MKSKLFVLLLSGSIVPVCALRSETADSLRNAKTYPIGEVVVTGTRHETDIRHLPMTISVVGRQKIAEGFRPSLLPTLTEQIPANLEPVITFLLCRDTETYSAPFIGSR